MRRMSKIGDRKGLRGSPRDAQRASRGSISSQTPESTFCRIVPVGKRRDGGTRFWCLLHKADATAKYGRAADHCRYAHFPQINDKDILTLDVNAYPGGIALWGAVPAVYDTTRLPLDRGIHVHTREQPGREKWTDRTYRCVRLIGEPLPNEGVLVSELDAIYYMVSSVFGYEMKHVTCSYCGDSHLDKDWFSIHPHRRHLCAGCGRTFRGTEIAIGNPICRVRELLGCRTHKLKSAPKKLEIRQADYPGGIQIWGSNPAFLWTAKRSEEEGIHVHAFTVDGSEPEKNDTYSEVIIDGIRLDASMVRTLMAQNALPHIAERVVAISCNACGKPWFATGNSAFTPSNAHSCSRCGRILRSTSRLRRIIGNPLLTVLDQLAAQALRAPQKHDLGLLPETI